MLYLTLPGVWMQHLDNFKTRNVFCTKCYVSHVLQRNHTKQCYEKPIETRTSCDNRNDRKKTQHGKTAKKNVGWTYIVVKCKRVTDALKRTRDRHAWKVRFGYIKKHWHLRDYEEYELEHQMMIYLSFGMF